MRRSHTATLRRCLMLVLAMTWACAIGVEPMVTGPETEKRFPPLKVPEGFVATLFACDPLIEYPSVIALGPRTRTVFVAHDYMTGLGLDIVRRDEVRLVEDSDGDGYADKSTVFAGGFNSIEGLAYDAGTVYVMHAPLLTMLRDRDGDGVADERRDLLSGLGLTPEDNPQRLHCANGVTPGHDGWLYLSLGDHGCDVARPEGDRLVLHGGGILRCRPDGKDLHVFATGTRNIYDVALDEDLNVFIRDNENDGGSYKVRVCHSFFGADHGYPYLYLDRPDEAMPPLADMGLGSSAGGAAYLEPGFPPEYRGNLFFCEWGRSVARYMREPAGSGFAPMKEIEFAAGAENDPYGFKPTDVVVDYDGSLLVSDWADGQRPKRGRGRIYRIRHKEQPAFEQAERAPTDVNAWIAQLNATSFLKRCEAEHLGEQQGREGLMALKQALKDGKVDVPGRLHAVWMLAKGEGRGASDALFKIAEEDSNTRVRAQVVRALADLHDPVLVQHRLTADRGDGEVASRLAALGKSADHKVTLEIVIALGRLQWSETPSWLQEHLKQPDTALAHASMQALRRAKNWPAVLTLLDQPDAAPMRPIALRAIAEQGDAVIIDGLRQRLASDAEPRHRKEYADALTRIHRLPGEWVYWGYRPGPRPTNVVAWEKTTAIELALDGALNDDDRAVRTATLRRMRAEQIPVRLQTLDRWLRTERDSEAVAAIIDALKDQPAEPVRELCESAVKEKAHSSAHRLAILEIFVRGLDAGSERRLIDVVGALEDGPVLAEALRQLGTRSKLESRTLLRGKLASRVPEVRAAALESIAALQDHEASNVALKLLEDPEARVRQAAALAVGRLEMKEAVQPLLLLAGDADLLVRRECLDALRRLHESGAVPPAQDALQHGTTQIVALECLAELGGPAQLDAVMAVATKNHAPDVLRGAVRAMTAWQQREATTSAGRTKLGEAVASVHGSGGLLLRWDVVGPLPAEEGSRVSEQTSNPAQVSNETVNPATRWQTRFTSGIEARVDVSSADSGNGNAVWLGVADVIVAEPMRVQFLGSGNGVFRVWLNGNSAYQRASAGAYAPDSDRFEAKLEKGRNRLVVQVPAEQGARFHLRFRQKSSNASHERLTQMALAAPGNAGRGREVFMNAEKSLCLKCHRLGEQGARIGPELTGAGSRFTRVYLIESILQPSRTIAPEYEYKMVELKDGPPMLGVTVTETRDTLLLGDLQGQHEIAKSRIAKMQPLPVSLMPEGLEKMLSEKEFVDLIAFLLEQK